MTENRTKVNKLIFNLVPTITNFSSHVCNFHDEND